MSDRRDVSWDEAERVAVAVARGVEWLTLHHGERWWEEVGWDAFSIDDSKLCVLGQLYGTYAAFGESLWWRANMSRWDYSLRAFSVQHGFLVFCWHKERVSVCLDCEFWYNREWWRAAAELRVSHDG